MGQVVIRKLDASTLAASRARAAARGRSLEQELRIRLAESAKPTRAEVRASAASIRALGGVLESVDLDLLIREDR